MSVVSHRFLLLVVNEAPYQGQQKCYTEAFAVLLFAFGVSGLALRVKETLISFHLCISRLQALLHIAHALPGTTVVLLVCYLAAE